MDPHQYINSFDKFGNKGGFQPGLSRVKALLKPFGHPEGDLPVIHVAGSNGKGSTVNIMKNIYKNAGYRVGVYTSPHLIDFNERITINDQKITDQELGELIEDLAPIVDKIKEDESIGKPSYFELITAIAILYFASQKVDITLLEVGLGGRFDATNVVSNPLAAVITSISLEHTSILGNTLAKIAGEKAGIIKKGSRVFTAVRDKEALAVIKKVAQDKKAEVIQIDESYDFEKKTADLSGQIFRIKQDGGKNRNYKISLLGDYQIRNAVLSLAVINSLQDDYPVGENAIRDGLKTVNWPGRMEVIQKKPLILLDGAHNPESFENFIYFIAEQLKNKDFLYLIIAVLADKNIEKMLGKLQNLTSEYKLIITKLNFKRAMSTKKIAEIADEKGFDYEVISDLKDAIITVREKLKPEEAMCITGSLYIIAEAKRVLSS
ncbi:MAG: bifunctional folylpolyglutamate synthase/dihydrofolate synthase [Halanaerobiales bacterium]